MTTKTTKAAKATKTTTSKKATTLHIAITGKGTPICGAKGKGGTAEAATCEACKKIAAHAEEKAKNEAKDSKAAKASLPLIGEAPIPAKPEAKAEKPEAKKAQPKTTAEPRERDSRLPPPGTTLKKVSRDGAVRCECKVTETGFIYKGTEFRSLSAAAMAAAKDLGVKGAQNGWLWWGLVKQQPRIVDPVEALQAAWERYHERIKAITGNELEKPVLVKVFNALEVQAREIAEISKAL